MMTYTHKTNHSYKPDTDFWRPFENLFINFPFQRDGNKYRSIDYLIEYYEIRTKDAFDVTDNDLNIYGQRIKQKFYKGRNIKEIGAVMRRMLPPNEIENKIDYPAKIVSFLAKHMEDPDTLHKFQGFIESVYFFLLDIQNLNPNNIIVRKYGADDKTHSNYEWHKERLFKDRGGLMKSEEFMNFFNTTCRKYNVPFVMFTQNDECYLVHTTDKFVEKIIQDLPIFLSHPDLRLANKLFVEAYRKRDFGEYKDCLAKMREGIEAVREYVYTRYSLTKSISKMYIK